jgi:endoglucanase
VINVWCHPLKRGLGPAPTTSTARPDKVDAYMWIGRPGYSGGSCNGGPLPIGTWWRERALMFANNATSWLHPPHGTRNGHRRRFSLRQLGG